MGSDAKQPLYTTKNTDTCIHISILVESDCHVPEVPVYPPLHTDKVPCPRQCLRLLTVLRPPAAPALPHCCSPSLHATTELLTALCPCLALCLGPLDAACVPPPATSQAQHPGQYASPPTTTQHHSNTDSSSASS
jgi:hypothetical protein